MQYIRRQIESKLLESITQFSSVAVTGPRQTGKSTLLQNTLPHYKYCSFDDPLMREQALSDPEFFLDSIGENVILDEIQFVPSLLSYIKIKIDENRNKKGLYVFTGSQKFSMIKNLSDSLAGRVALLELLPFSFTEVHKVHKTGGVSGRFFLTALNSAYPEPIIQKGMDIKLWYGSYIQTYLERDIKTIYNIGDIRDFQRFIHLLATRCGQVLNLSSFANDLGVSVPTINRWLSILEASRLVYLLQPYYRNLNKRVTKSPKIYFTDCGLVTYLTGISDQDALLQGPLAGALFENYCIQETLKVFFNRGIQPNIYYIRTNNNFEIDLIIERGLDIIPIEIKLSKTPKREMGKNISSLKELFPKLNFKKGYLLCLSDKTFSLNNDVDVITFSDYLNMCFHT
ncbi:ATP-binding protein [Candidatus Margulisiibacteriota bacterium]